MLPIDPTAPPYNAKFDWQAYYANTTAGSNAVHVGAGTTFTTADIGKQVIVKKAGNASGTASLWGWVGGASGGNALLYTDLTFTTPANAASTQSGAECAWGSDDTAALNAAFAGAVANGGPRCVQLPAGWARASQLKIPNGCKIRSAGWGDGWGVFSHLNAGSTLGGQTSKLGTLLQQLEGATTDFVVFSSDQGSGTLAFLGPLDIELGAVQGPFVTAGSQHGIAMRTPDGSAVPGRPQDGFRLTNTHVIGFPGDGFNLPNGAVPLQGFDSNRAFYNGGYGFHLVSVNGGAVQMCHLENFSGDANSRGLVLIDGVTAGLVKVSALKSEANSFSQQHVAANAHEWVPVNDVAQLNCITLNNCSAQFVIEGDHICAASAKAGSLYAPGPLVSITGTGSPAVDFNGNVRTYASDTIFPGSAGPLMINDATRSVTVPNTTRHGYYTTT